MLIWERERVLCCYMYLYIHWLIPICVLTGDWIHNLGASRQYSNWPTWPGLPWSFSSENIGADNIVNDHYSWLGLETIQEVAQEESWKLVKHLFNLFVIRKLHLARSRLFIIWIATMSSINLAFCRALQKIKSSLDYTLHIEI